MAGYSDFHCHLDDAAYEGRRDLIIADSVAAGLERLVLVGDAYSERSLALTAELQARHEAVACTAGAHPHQAGEYTAATEKRLSVFLERHRAMALGEVGLDFHYDFAPRDTQLAVFRRQVALAGEMRLPLVIHSRAAEAQVLQALEAERFAGRVVFHCYTGRGDEAREILARGYFLSFSGIITFRNAAALRQVVAETPVDRLFSETDSPYLSPEPERGRTNTPLAVIRVVQKIAAVKGLDEGALRESVAANFLRLND